jgi:hypothetical protein
MFIEHLSVVRLVTDPSVKNVKFVYLLLRLAISWSLIEEELTWNRLNIGVLVSMIVGDSGIVRGDRRAME